MVALTATEYSSGPADSTRFTAYRIECSPQRSPRLYKGADGLPHPFMPLAGAAVERSDHIEVMRRLQSRNRSDRIPTIILRQVSEHAHLQFSEASRVGFLT